jgi:hypothetical protein
VPSVSVVDEKMDDEPSVIVEDVLEGEDEEEDEDDVEDDDVGEAAHTTPPLATSPVTVECSGRSSLSP